MTDNNISNIKNIGFINFFKNLGRKKIVALSAIAVVIIFAVISFTKKEVTDYTTVAVQRGDIAYEVSVTGRVKPSQDADLAFETSGKISKIYADVGDKVIQGQALVSLNNAEISAQLAQATAGVESAEAQLNQYKASLESEQSKLAEMKRGTRAEEITIQETKVANAEQSLREAKNSVIDKIQDAYTKSDDAIRNKADQFFNNSKSSSPQISFTTTNSQFENDAEWARFILESDLVSWKSSVDNIKTSDDMKILIAKAKSVLLSVKDLLDKSSSLLSGAVTSSSLTQTTIDGWKTDISTARTNINTAITNIYTVEEKLSAAEASLLLEQKNLALSKAGTAPEQITAQEAQVRKAEANIVSQEAQIRQAEANVQNYQAQLYKTIIRSPINGIVTKQDAKIGEIVPANTSIVSVMSESKFEIEADIPEVDISEIAIGDNAKITLEAYGDTVIFDAKVVSIDPAETMIEGVATYKTTLNFNNEDSRIKSGMTADMNILADKKEGVLIVPQRAITAKNGDKIVKVLSGENVTEKKVKVGLKGSDGNIEILEGLEEGEKVIVSVTAK